jgi:hypothetical protein
MTSVFKVSFAALIIAVGTVAIRPALAHHSSAGFSEDSRVVSGTVKEFQFRNPHSWIQVNVMDASGKVTEWSVEWGSPNQLGREGIRPSTFPTGAAVRIRLRPDLTGQPIGIFVGAKMSDGKTVGKWSEE